MPAMKLNGFLRARAHLAHRLEVRKAGRHQHVGAGLLECLQALDRVVQVGLAAQEVFRPGGQEKPNGSERATFAAAATRATACSKS